MLSGIMEVKMPSLVLLKQFDIDSVEEQDSGLHSS